MTAFADYLDLRTAVLEEVKRPDIADVFDRLTRLAEARLNRALRTVDQITDATATFSSGVSPLPSDLSEVIGLYDSYGREYVQQPPQATQTIGQSGYFSVYGGNLVSAQLSGDYVLQYYAAVPTLTTSLTTSNWLLQKYPAVYLYAVGLEAAKYLREVELAQAMQALLGMEIEEAMGADRSMRYARARVRVQGVTP